LFKSQWRTGWCMPPQHSKPRRREHFLSREGYIHAPARERTILQILLYSRTFEW
jgi:hypothetical protein